MTEAVKAVLQQDEESVLVVYPKWCWTAPNVMGILFFDLLWIVFFSFFTYLVMIGGGDMFFSLVLIPFWGIAVAIPVGVLWCRMRLKRTVYVVTHLRAIVFRPSVFSLRMQTRVWPLEQSLIKQIVERKNGVGDVVFGFRKDFEVNGHPMPEGFLSVPEVRRVQEILKAQIIAACGPAAVETLPPAPATPATAAAEPQTKRPRRRPWWFGLFFVVAGLMDIGIGSVFIQDDSALQENGIRTTATVVKMRKGDAPAPVVTFRDADGVSHTVKNPYSSSEFSHLQVGDEVEILYMPDTPRDMQIITENPFSIHWIVWGIGVVFILVGLGMCVVDARKK